MRLLKVMLVFAAVLDLAMFLQSPSSPLSTTSPIQAVGFAADNTEVAAVGVKP